MFKIKYLIHRMQCHTVPQQVWWIDGKDVNFCLKGQGIKLHKWCVCGQSSYILIALSVCDVTIMLPVLHFLWQNRPLYITAPR